MLYGTVVRTVRQLRSSHVITEARDHNHHHTSRPPLPPFLLHLRKQPLHPSTALPLLPASSPLPACSPPSTANPQWPSSPPFPSPAVVLSTARLWSALPFNRPAHLAIPQPPTSPPPATPPPQKFVLSAPTARPSRAPFVIPSAFSRSTRPPFGAPVTSARPRAPFPVQRVAHPRKKPHRTLR